MEPLVIPRIFVNALTSTGGSGPLNARIIYNITGGTILTSGTTLTPSNFNPGKGTPVQGTILKGGTGLTFSGGITESVPQFVWNSVPVRELIGFDVITLERGTSALLTVTPPAGNTSMIVQCGCNFYRGTPERNA